MERQLSDAHTRFQRAFAEAPIGMALVDLDGAWRQVNQALDLDNFKYVKDTLGHAMGDELIVRVANALRERLRDTDIIARLGGDEFAIILPETDTAAAGSFATGLLETIARDGVVLDERRTIQVSASIGLAAIERGVLRTPAELMMNADVARYDAKEAGRGRYSVHDAAAAWSSRSTSRGSC